MKKLNNNKKIIISLSSIIFLTTLTIFISFIIEPRNISSNDKEKINYINIDLGDEVIKTKMINSLVEFKATSDGHKKVFSSVLIKQNFYLILEEAIKLCKDIKYKPSEINSSIFFKILTDSEISIKLELIPKNNYLIQFNSKFRLLIK